MGCPHPRLRLRLRRDASVIDIDSLDVDKAAAATIDGRPYGLWPTRPDEAYVYGGSMTAYRGCQIIKLQRPALWATRYNLVLIDTEGRPVERANAGRDSIRIASRGNLPLSPDEAIEWTFPAKRPDRGA